jgi:hypothetical protein
MPRILTKLRIDEVSAVDRGAGRGVKVILMKRQEAARPPRYDEFLKLLKGEGDAADMGKRRGDPNYRSVATGATYPKDRVPDVIDDDENDDEEEDDMDINKADRGGAHDLAGRLVQHLTEALDAKRERHGFAKAQPAKEQPVDSILQIMKSGGIGATCAAIVAKGSTTITEHELVEAVTAVAHDRHSDLSPAQAFSKIYSAATDEARCLRDAINITKNTQPSVISGGDLRDAGDAAAAMDQLREIGRRMAPTATPEKQFSVAFEDPKNVALALRAHQRPAPVTSFPHPVR